MRASEGVRQTRSNVRMDARLTRANGGTQDVQVEDIALDGCRVRGYFLVGEQVSIELPRIGAFRATVCWAGKGHAGLNFQRDVVR